MRRNTKKSFIAENFLRDTPFLCSFIQKSRRVLNLDCQYIAFTIAQNSEAFI